VIPVATGAGDGLAPGRVDVWSAPLEPPPPLGTPLPGYLSPDERARAVRFVFVRDRDRFVAGRSFLRLLLAQYAGREPGNLRFHYGPNGKPALAETDCRLTFNLAHSGALAVCAIAPGGGDVGVDVERVRPIRDARGVARAAFSSGEVARLESLPESLRLQAFYEAWTRKEAFLKALGSGLGRSLDSFEVSFGPGEPPRLLRTLGDPREVQRFSLHSFEPEAGFVGAVAFAGGMGPVRHRNWRWTEIPGCPL
jgi:4'-phosphopantetheinyl transferase